MATQGPNVKKLIVRKMSLIMVPPDGNFIGAVKAFDNLGDIAREATDWVMAAIRAVKTAPDNPYGDDDEAIAGKILQGIEERKSTSVRPPR